MNMKRKKKAKPDFKRNGIHCKKQKKVARQAPMAVATRLKLVYFGMWFVSLAVLFGLIARQLNLKSSNQLPLWGDIFLTLGIAVFSGVFSGAFLAMIGKLEEYRSLKADLIGDYLARVFRLGAYFASIAPAFKGEANEKAKEFYDGFSAAAENWNELKRISNKLVFNKMDSDAKEAVDSIEKYFEEAFIRARSNAAFLNSLDDVDYREFKKNESFFLEERESEIKVLGNKAEDGSMPVIDKAKVLEYWPKAEKDLEVWTRKLEAKIGMVETFSSRLVPNETRIIP